MPITTQLKVPLFLQCVFPHSYFSSLRYSLQICATIFRTDCIYLYISLIFPQFIHFNLLTQSIWLHILNSGPEAAVTYEFSVYFMNTSHEHSIPYPPLCNWSYLEEQYCMQVRQYITIHKATKQIWYIVSKSHMCNTVLFFPNTQHNDGCKQKMYRTRHSWQIDTRHWY